MGQQLEIPSDFFDNFLLLFIFALCLFPTLDSLFMSQDRWGVF